MKRKQPSPRRPKPKKCAECERHKNLLRALQIDLEEERKQLEYQLAAKESWEDACQRMYDAKEKVLAERDESRKQHLVATQRNVELTGELRKLQAFKDLALGLAQRDLAGNLHIKAEDAKNCLQ